MKITLLTFLILLSMGSVSVKAQDSTLIADETWITQLKTGAKLVTYSESVFKDVSLKWGEQFKSIHIYYKNDRHGGYKEYVIYFSIDVANNIRNWAKTNL